MSNHDDATPAPIQPAIPKELEEPEIAHVRMCVVVADNDEENDDYTEEEAQAEWEELMDDPVLGASLRHAMTSRGWR